MVGATLSRVVNSLTESCGMGAGANIIQMNMGMADPVGMVSTGAGGATLMCGQRVVGLPIQMTDGAATAFRIGRDHAINNNNNNNNNSNYGGGGYYGGSAALLQAAGVSGFRPGGSFTAYGNSTARVGEETNTGGFELIRRPSGSYLVDNSNSRSIGRWDIGNHPDSAGIDNTSAAAAIGAHLQLRLLRDKEEQQQQQQQQQHQQQQRRRRGGVATHACQDCGNQAKKDCSHLRCRTCCKSRGFDCPTHLQSTWIPAAKRRERQEAVLLGGPSSSSTPRSKRARMLALAAAAAAHSHNSTSTSASAGSPTHTPLPISNTNHHHSSQLVRFGPGTNSPAYGNFPSEVRASAMFKCVKIWGLDEEKTDGEEYAYRTTVRIGGRLFTGMLYDQGSSIRDMNDNDDDDDDGDGDGNNEDDDDENDGEHPQRRKGRDDGEPSSNNNSKKKNDATALSQTGLHQNLVAADGERMGSSLHGSLMDQHQATAEAHFLNDTGF